MERSFMTKRPFAPHNSTANAPSLELAKKHVDFDKRAKLARQSSCETSKLRYDGAESADDKTDELRQNHREDCEEGAEEGLDQLISELVSEGSSNAAEAEETRRSTATLMVSRLGASLQHARDDVRLKWRSVP
jgi:hypothetical protein